jgi:hypothetical protein
MLSLRQIKMFHSQVPDNKSCLEEFFFVYLNFCI